MCGGPTGPSTGAASGSGGPRATQQARPSTSGWFRIPLLDYPVTPAVGILAAVLVGSGVALGVAARVRARPPAATHPG